MASQSHQPLVVKSEVEGIKKNDLDVCATRSEDSKILVLKVVNFGDRPVAASFTISGFQPTKPIAKVKTLTAPLNGRNTASNPKAVAPTPTDWKHGLHAGDVNWTFPVHSYTVIELQGSFF